MHEIVFHFKKLCGKSFFVKTILAKTFFAVNNFKATVLHANRRSMISGILSARHTGSLAFWLLKIF